MQKKVRCLRTLNYKVCSTNTIVHVCLFSADLHCSLWIKSWKFSSKWNYNISSYPVYVSICIANLSKVSTLFLLNVFFCLRKYCCEIILNVISKIDLLITYKWNQHLNDAFKWVIQLNTWLQTQYLHPNAFRLFNEKRHYFSGRIGIKINFLVFCWFFKRFEPMH